MRDAVFQDSISHRMQHYIAIIIDINFKSINNKIARNCNILFHSVQYYTMQHYQYFNTTNTRYYQ